MRIGHLNITKCSQCSFVVWSGEDEDLNDLGYQCDKGAWGYEMEIPENIPKNCPFKEKV